MILFLSILFMLFQHNGSEKKQLASVHTAQTLVAVFSVLKEKGEPLVVLKTKQTIDGRPRNLQKTVAEDGDLLCVLVGKNGKTLDSVLIANPLVQDVEFLNERDELTRRRIMLDSGAFIVRIGLRDGANRLVVRLAKEKKVLMGFDIK